MTLRELMAEEDPATAISLLIGYTPKRVLVNRETGKGWQAVYVYINPRHMGIRQIFRCRDVNDGTVDVALLDLDAAGKAIGLELVLLSDADMVGCQDTSEVPDGSKQRT